MLDVTLHNVAGIEITVPDDEDIAAGHPPLIAIVVTGITPLPIANPEDPGRPIVIPSMIARYRLNGELAEKHGQALLDAAKTLPKPSRIQVANSLGGVDQAVAQMDAFRGD